LQTFADVDQAIENLSGSTFALEAEEPLLSTLKELTYLLNGNWVVLKPGDKVLYHAAAVFACNYLVTLFKLALDLWLDFGVSAKEATRALSFCLGNSSSTHEENRQSHCHHRCRYNPAN